MRSVTVLARGPRLVDRCRRHWLLVAGVLTAAPAGGRAVLGAQPAEEAAPCLATAASLPQLNALRGLSGRLRRGESTCVGLSVRQGEFIRLSVDSPDPWVRARIIDPRRGVPLVVAWTPERYFWPDDAAEPFAFEAPTTDTYVVELGVPPLPGVPRDAAAPFSLQIDEWRSAATQAAHRDDLRRDPRTDWLREHAASIRSLDPDDADFADLNFLREQLRGVRVVLLGEEHHGVGATFRAKTRLIRFLHEEMGFDVLAFESDIYAMSVAWAALRSGAEPREAFARGAAEVWARSQQLQPLLDHLARSARSDRPLELVGFDSQFTGTTARWLLRDLRTFLLAHAIDSPFAAEQDGSSEIFAGILDGRFARDPAHLPSRDDQEVMIRGLRETATKVEHAVAGRDGAFWGRVLRSAAVQVGLYLDGLRPDASVAAYTMGRDRQMAENLVWLANVHHRGRKLIVWAANVHIMRNPPRVSALLPTGYDHPTMGDGVWGALGQESLAVGFTSYQGRTAIAHDSAGTEQDIVADQVPAFEFEELMHAAGLTLGWVDLRDSPARDVWLGGTFWARPLWARAGQASWCEVFDALFYVGQQEPSSSTR